MAEEKAPEEQAPSTPASAPETVAPPAEQKTEQKEEKRDKPILDPAAAAREAIFNIIKDDELKPDEKISQVAPLLKTICEHRPPKDNETKRELDKELGDTSPRAAHRYHSLFDKPIPKANPPDESNGGVLKPLS